MKVALVAALLGASTVAGARPMPTKIDVVPMPLRAARPLAPAEPSSRIIYMRRCPIQGCQIHFGPSDDSRTDTSMIAGGAITITRFKQTQEVWDALMTCMKATYAPYNITITDVDPGTTPHYEHVVGGNSSTELDPMLTGAGGVSPFTCADIPNAITYTFDVYGPDPDQLCWTAAQETAHAFGLEHEINNGDPLTYLNGPLPKRFKSTDTPCGEYSARACQCGGTMQNSHRYIETMFGPGTPTPPTVTITSPSDGKKVQPQFAVRADAVDDTGIDHVELYVDGAKVAETTVEPYVLVAPDGIAEGPHTIEVRAIDVQNVAGSAMLDVDLGPPCTAAKGCSGDEVCVMGGCVAGPDAPGGLGNQCQHPTECLSKICVGDATTKYCVEPCDLSQKGVCPDSFECVADGNAGGVCFPAPDGGCCQSGGSPNGPALLGLGVLAVVTARRRRG